MTGFYQNCLANAASLLFGMALVMLVSGAVPALLVVQQMAHTLGDPSGGFEKLQIIQSLLNGVSAAVWPFFGAAVVWRIDRHFATIKKVAEA